MIANKLATLRELETYYSMDDALDILEAWAVSRYNQYIASQPSRGGSRRP